MKQRRAKTLLSDPDLTVRLSWYDPGETMSDHVHDHGQVSVLLAGGFREISDARTADNSASHIGYKPACLAHANRYGTRGALILSVNFDEAALSSVTPWMWRTANPDEILLTRRMVASGLGNSDLRNLATDLIAYGSVPTRRRGTPPNWANCLREELQETGGTDLNQAARNFGIHRAHLSRGFRKWFGASPSLYGLRCRMGRAVRELARGEPAADAAVLAGFSDQSHLIRTLNRETGLTPNQLSRLIAA